MPGAGRLVGILLITLSPLQGATAQDLAITDVAIVHAERNEVRRGMTVLVRGDRIVAVGPAGSVSIPDGARRIDGAGAFVIPGLWDMHVHSSSDRNTRDIVFPLYIANGITGVRDLNADCFDPCHPLQTSIETVHRWRRDIEAGELVGPRLVASGPIIHGPAPGDSSSVEAPGTREHGRALARLLARRGVDLIKVYDELPREAFLGLVEEGRRLGLPVVGHIPFAVPASEAAEAGMRSMEHLFGIIDACSTTESEQRPRLVELTRTGDERAMAESFFQSLQNFSLEKCAVLYEQLSRQDVWAVPTLVAGETTADGIEWRKHDGMRYLPREELEFWMRTLADDAVTFPGGFASFPYITYRLELITLDLHRAGVPLLAGSDALAPGVFPGFGLHDELQRLVDAGLTPGEALHASTLEPARYLAATDSLGSIAEGKVADFVVLDANPLEDIANTRRIRAVVTRGRVHDRAAIDALLDGAARFARRE